jgi:hypothetical protein
MGSMRVAEKLDLKGLNIKWTDGLTNGEVFQRAKEERLLLKIFK